MTRYNSLIKVTQTWLSNRYHNKCFGLSGTLLDNLTTYYGSLPPDPNIYRYDCPLPKNQNINRKRREI